MIARKYRKKIQQDLTLLIPTQTRTAKELYDATDALTHRPEEITDVTHLNHLRAINESIDAQAKFLEHASNILAHLSHADGASTYRAEKRPLLRQRLAGVVLERLEECARHENARRKDKTGCSVFLVIRREKASDYTPKTLTHP